MSFSVSTRLWDFARPEPPAESPRGTLPWGAAAFAKQVADLGATSVELDSRIPERRFDEVVGAVKNHGLAITSIEAVCPHPSEFGKHEPRPGLVPLVNPDESERRVAIRLHRRTIEIAADVSAKNVVLTLGRVALPPAFSFPPEGERETRAFLAARALEVPPFLDALRFSLDHLIPVAEKYERTLAIAVSSDLAAVPSFQELRAVLEDFRGAPLGVWLDVSALWSLEHAGVRRAETWSELRPSVRGVRIRDLRNGTEVVPGEGGIHLAAIKKALALPDDVSRVLDLGAQHDPGRVRDAVLPARRAVWP